MSYSPSWLADFNLGEYVGIGLDSAQIGYLAGALFLTLFSLSALSHAKRASGFVPAIWIAVAIGLLAGTLLLVSRGLPDLVPDWLRPFTDPDRLARAAAAVALLGGACVLLSARWVHGTMARLVYRIAGLAMAGLAVWLAAGWFADEIPEEVREWTARTVLVRIGIILGLLCLSAAFWMRQAAGTPVARWVNRALTPPAIAIAVVLAGRWFGTQLGQDFPTSDVVQVTCILAAIGFGTCLLIAGGAHLLRERPIANRVSRRPLPIAIPVVQPAARLLPVAMLLDDRGRPQLPTSNHQAGPAGA